MKKGIIMEINDTCLTLLTPDGQFLQSRKQKQPYTIGEEILFTPIAPKRLVYRFFGVKQLSIAAAAIFIIAGSLVPVYQSNKAYAYMSIDVNPSIEIGVNKQIQVVQVKAYNSDGKKIISHIGDWEKKNVTEFTENVLKEMKKEGYLDNHHSMVLSTVRIENSEEQTEKQLTEKIDEIKEIAKENKLQVTEIDGTEKDMEEAHQLGITTGKYKEEKIHKAQEKYQQTAPKPADGDSDNGIQNNNPNQAVNQEEANGINPPVSNQATTSIDQGKANENHIPPGQLKKAEETPKENHIPPGQLKKNEETPKKWNQPDPKINGDQTKKLIQSDHNKKD
jgi:hypothetical protein